MSTWREMQRDWGADGGGVYRQGGKSWGRWRRVTGERTYQCGRSEDEDGEEEAGVGVGVTAGHVGEMEVMV